MSAGAHTGFRRIRAEAKPLLQARIPMERKLISAGAMVAIMVMAWTPAYPDDVLRVKSAAEAVEASLGYLREQYPQVVPAAGMRWREQTIFSGGPVDLVTTSKQFTSDTWSIEVSQTLAPLKNIVYQVELFHPGLGWHWKGRITADGNVREESAFRQLPEAERRKTAEEFIKRSRIPPPQGGYGH
jgi:hypothetical protein